MKNLLMTFSIALCLLANGEDKRPWQKGVSCRLDIKEAGGLREGQSYECSVTLAYEGGRERLVSRSKTITFIIQAKDGKEIPTEPWGADGFRAPSFSDYRMILGGESTTWRFGATIKQKDGKWEFVWYDTFGAWHGCRFDSVNGAKLLVKYENAPTKDLALNGWGGGTLNVPREQIWSGVVKSNAVPLKQPSGLNE